MKNFKKITLLLMVGAILFTPALGVVTPFLGRASATVPVAGGSGNTTSAPADNASPEDQLRSYIYMRAIVHCLRASGPTDSHTTNPFNSGTSTSDINNYKWFGSPVDATLGYLDTDDGNGYSTCDDSGQTKKWMSAAYQIWGFSDPIAAACNSGWKRDGKSSSETVHDCIAGDGNVNGDLTYKYGDNNQVANAFIKTINSKFYGVDSTSLPAMPDSVKYLYYTESFAKLCGPHEIDGSGYTQSDIDGDPHLYRYTDADGKTHTFQADKAKSDSVRTEDTGNYQPVTMTCGDIVKAIQGSIPAYTTALAVSGSSTDPNAIDPGQSPDLQCAGFSLANILTIEWMACPLIQGGMKLAGSLEDNISGLLCINEASIFKGASQTCSNSSTQTNPETQAAYYKAWQVFRNIALGLIVMAGLFMVISQGLGFEFLDAYVVKKTLPRLLVAGIGISLSWSFLAFLVQFSNGLGIGVRSLIYAPFSGINHIVLQGGANALDHLLGIGSIAGVGAIIASTSVLGILALVATAVIAILVAFFTLILRNILVIFLILMAPVAIAAYVLPNTEKYWKLWWEWLFKALLVFPIITGMIAIGHVFAAITSQSAAQGQVVSTLNVFVSVIAYFAPYFLIPAAFRFAGGALSTIGGFTNDRSRGAFDRLKNFRQNDRAKTWKRSGEGERFNKFGVQNTKVGGIVNRRLANVTQPASFIPGSLGDPARARLSTNVSRLTNEGAKHLQELGLLDDAAGNEFIQHGHSVGQLRSRVNELKSQGKDGLAAQLSAYASLAGDRGAMLGAMKLNAGFGKLEDGSLEQLDHLFSNSQSDQAAKQAAFGDLIFTSKGAGNWATYAARIEDGKVRTMSQEDYRDKAMENMANSLLDAGPNELSRIKPYDNKTERTREDGTKYTVEYNTRDVTAEAVAKGVEKAKTPEEFYRALEQLAMQRQSGGYNTPKMKAAFDKAMNYVDNPSVSLTSTANPEKKTTRELYDDIEKRVRRSGADEEALRRSGDMGSGGGPAPTPGT